MTCNSNMELCIHVSVYANISKIQCGRNADAKQCCSSKTDVFIELKSNLTLFEINFAKRKMCYEMSNVENVSN